MPDCETCFNCRVTIKLGKPDKNHPTYKSLPIKHEPFDRKLVMTEVFCRAGHWRKDNGEEFRYKTWNGWITRKKNIRTHPSNCPDYMP